MGTILVKLCFCRHFVLLLLLWPLPAQASGPENVAVVVNNQSWASRAIANEFVHLRNIPANNVVRLNSVPDIDQIDVDTFRAQILLPVLKTIEQRGLPNQIDYVIYSSDFPTAIQVRSDAGKQKLPRVITPVASINGLTYLYRYVLAKNVGYLQLDVNRYMRMPKNSLRGRLLSKNDRKRLQAAQSLIAAKKWAQAAKAFRELIAVHPHSATLHYNLACCLARNEQPDAAVKALQQAMEVGWNNFDHTSKDPDLDSLRQREDFRQLLKSMGDKLEVQPTRGFRSQYAWNEFGQPELSSGQAEQYLLSTMLGVTSGRGNSVSEVLSALRRSVQADGTQPEGTIYLMVNGNVRSTTRQGVFSATKAALAELGVKAEIVQGTIPKQRDDVQGCVVGTAGFDWKSSGSQILPGAICEHLTSFGGMMRERAGQTPLSEFIRYGAAGSSGTVTEPFAIQAKFPFPFIHVHYARGCTLAEAFYQSVRGPYQLLIVGDPLCRPWAKLPQVAVPEIKPHQKLAGFVTFHPEVTDRPAEEIDRYELFLNGQLVGTCEAWGEFDIDTTLFPDGHHELRVVAVTRDALATRGGAILPVRFANFPQQFAVEPLPEELAWDQPLRLSAKLPGARQIRFFLGKDAIGSISGEEGSVEIPAEQLGPGPIEIQPIALLDEPYLRRVHGPPLQVRIVPPAAIPAVEVKAEQLQPGLELQLPEEKQVVIADTQPRDWLRKAEAPQAGRFSLSAYFQVPEEEVYQFQLRTGLKCELSVDGHKLPAQTTPDWQFLPVPLQPGWHRFELTGELSDNPGLQIRFGGRGAQSLEEKRFLHLPESRPVE